MDAPTSVPTSARKPKIMVPVEGAGLVCARAPEPKGQKAAGRR